MRDKERSSWCNVKYIYIYIIIIRKINLWIWEGDVEICKGMNSLKGFCVFGSNKQVIQGGNNKGTNCRGNGDSVWEERNRGGRSKQNVLGFYNIRRGWLMRERERERVEREGEKERS